MSKRTAVPADGEPQFEKRHVKRPRLDAPRGPPPKAEEIHSSRQLQQLLTFQQDAIQQVRNGIQSLKVFLESIVYPTDDSSVSRQRAILREFLETQKPRVADKDAPFLSNLMQTWSFAEQSNNDHLSSAVVSVLALLLKTLSTHVDLQEPGLQLCRTILQPAQLKLVSRGLSAPKHKEHVISPCLRLLTEVVSFDGGAVSKQVYSKRDFTFDAKILARNLGIRRSAEDAAKDRRKPAVRTNAVKYLLANFRLQNEGVKMDILKQGLVLKALFDHIRDDPPEVATEILQVVKSHIIADKEIPRSSKSHVLNDRALASIACLYRVEQAEDDSEEKSLDVVAHQFLLQVCTSSESGVLVPSSGWYPPGTDKDLEKDDQQEVEDSNINLGLDSLEWYERYRGRVIIRNPTLATFMQGLRPHGNKLEQELVLAIFDACPELFADYFFKKTNFPFDPKLTATWIGYSSFLFSAIQLHVPHFLGRKDSYATVPPPVSIVIENLLPQPLTQKALTRCLNQNSDLITFFAIRLLTIAFQKLELVLQEFKKASSKQQHTLWDQAAERLVSEFTQRCPKMKDVISAFRNTNEENLMQREAATRLLSMYYVVIPQVALDEKFDVSMALATALHRVEKQAVSGEEGGVQLLELGHLVQIARHAPDMRWWQKPESLQFSPFTSVLKVLASSPDAASAGSIAQLLSSVVRDQGILQAATQPSAFDAFVTSLRTSEGAPIADAVFSFLDDCFGRLVRKPIKYQDDLDTLAMDRAEGSNVSLLLLTVAEQWPFVVKSGSDVSSKVAGWLASFLTLLQQIGEDRVVLQSVLDKVLKAAAGASYQKTLKKALKQRDAVEVKQFADNAEDRLSLDKNMSSAIENDAEDDVATSLELPPEEDENHPGLHKWIQKEVEEAVDDGNIGDLILCLCSTHTAIRKQALSNLQKLMSKVQSSNYEEKEMMYLLLGETVETAREIIHEKQFPYVAGVFATHAVTVIADPTHFMYPKVSAFLTKGPSWNIGRIPSSWAEKIILNPPEDDNAYWKEVDWLLDFFVDGLRIPEDMEIFRARNVFERILALYTFTNVSQKTREKIIRLVFRAAAVGGSTTLITRSGVLSWIEMQLVSKTGNAAVLRQLAARLYETCDQGRVEEWSHGGAKSDVQRITGS
ncbi:uncharacterized protein K452DRAFT_247410 [Aplosporella prunicola CBS 121167]|uniref:Ribosome biogenesis protein Urb1 n=1 Tax=Aplosporella prunicola CBS 121167 TaxID=1176127 RepID=A0A6A6BM43_9PEZI|nr:uncharacterized protein K452DRAFT_247410 [Aplosporella prunicola CBS 121167]KAF2143907.1 hypothetical protein K452DRAFT_247410 [Aplosporella prunicola CBS 121167]